MYLESSFRPVCSARTINQDAQSATRHNVPHVRTPLPRPLVSIQSVTPNSPHVSRSQGQSDASPLPNTIPNIIATAVTVADPESFSGREACVFESDKF